MQLVQMKSRPCLPSIAQVPGAFSKSFIPAKYQCGKFLNYPTKVFYDGLAQGGLSEALPLTVLLIVYSIRSGVI